MIFFLFFVTFECDFDKSFDSAYDLFCLFVGKMGEHRDRLDFLHGDIVFPCYIFLFNVFHEVGVWGSERMVGRTENKSTIS